MSRLVLHATTSATSSSSFSSRRRRQCSSLKVVPSSSFSSTSMMSSRFSLGEFQRKTIIVAKKKKTKGTTRTTTIQSSSSNNNSNLSSTVQSLKSWWKKSAKIDKKTIASLGSACLLSYGFVSNLFYVSSLLLATYTAIKTTGQSPVTSSESLKVFASSYFGLWMIQNVLRPARFAFSVAISPKTDKVVEFFQKYVPGNKKSLAFGLTVFSVNIVGTIAYMFGGFALIYAMTGVPLDVGKLFGAAVAAKKAGGVVA
ncbi:unnamed protein product [Bathycoccus prasinos]